MPAPPARIEVKGLKELSRELRKTPARLDKELRKANKLAVTRALVPPVRSKAPRRSGALAGSVQGRATSQRSQLIVGSNVKVPYAGPINFGWAARNIRPQEFIYSGINQGNTEMLEIYLDFIDRAVKPAFPHGHL